MHESGCVRCAGPGPQRTPFSLTASLKVRYSMLPRISAHQQHLDRFLRRCPSSPASLRLRGHEHASADAVNLTLQENVYLIWALLDRVEVPSHAASSIIHTHLRSTVPSSSAILNAPRTPRPWRCASRRRSISQARSACCRISCTRC